MARFSAQGVALLVLVTFIANSNGLWYDCGTTLSQRLVRFNTFTAYPSPAIPGQELHLRATYQAYTELDESARVEMNIMYGDSGDQASVLHVTDIPLCNFTSSVSCPVAVTPNYTQAISFDYLVPALADGNYMVNFKISLPARARALACLAFNISIYNPSATQNGVFTSSYEAQLEAQAVFSSDSFLSRNVGSYIQIGPIGPLGLSPPWGTFDYISGTADVVHPSFDATNYVWGLSGILNTTSVTSDNFPSHIYYGQFWIGYSGPYGSYVTANNTLTNGTFVLVHSLINPGNETYSGILTFTPSGGAFPTGWYNPINLARLGQSTLYTNQYGHLVVGASAGACLNDPTEPSCRAGSNQVTQAPSRDNDRRDYLLKIILPVVLGFLLIVLIAAILAIRYKRKNRRASEDRVYNPRPAEYGSALVVDDIMQKSRNHTGAELPILDPSSRQAFPPAYLEAYPVPELSKPRGQVRRTPQEAPRDDRRRPSQGRSRPAPRRPAYSDTDSEPQLRGRGNRSPSPNGRDASRSRSRSRSPSDRSRSVSRSRSASPSDRRSRSRSVSRSLSRSRSPASGSSRSRSSFSEGPRR